MFRSSSHIIHNFNILAVLGYPSINLFLYNPIFIDITPKVFEIVHLYLISMSCNVILTCDGARLMTITSVFMRLSLSWYFVKAAFQVVIHFSSSSFVAAVCALSFRELLLSPDPCII